MTAWSYSSLTAFETCPRRYELTRLSKRVVEPQTEALTHGNEVHKSLELAVSGVAPLPERHAKYGPIVQMASAAPGEKKVELKFGLTKNLQETDFFSTDVWVRGVIDYAAVQTHSASVLDWKTGKPKPDSDQLKLFAAATFSLFPTLQTVRTGFVWLAYNKVDSETFERSDVDSIWCEFRPRVARVELAAATGSYPPRPSGLCRKHCPVPFSMCEFSGKQS